MAKIKLMNYIPVVVGDFVKIYFDHSKETEEGTVVDVATRKYNGRINGGTIGLNPLVTILTKDGEKKSFDNSFIKEVVRKKYQARRKENIYREIKNPGCLENIIHKKTKGKTKLACPINKTWVQILKEVRLATITITE